MNSRLIALAAVGLTGLASVDAHAWEVRVRFIERVGNTDVVLPGGDRADFRLRGSTMRVRMQVGVFDDQTSAAPRGGVVLVAGSLSLDGVRGTRTPGRLTNFTFPENRNGSPAADPFFSLTQIEAGRGPQTLAWECQGGQPSPQPAVVVRGVNTYVSVWETTVEFGSCGTGYMTFEGSVQAAGGWAAIGTPIPPECNPPTPGSVTYGPTGLSTIPINRSLYFDNGPPGPNPPPHFFNPCNWHQDLFIDTRDFFAFLDSFFDGWADANCDDITNSADFFFFLDQFLGVCST